MNAPPERRTGCSLPWGRLVMEEGRRGSTVEMRLDVGKAGCARRRPDALVCPLNLDFLRRGRGQGFHGETIPYKQGYNRGEPCARGPHGVTGP